MKKLISVLILSLVLSSTSFSLTSSAETEDILREDTQIYFKANPLEINDTLRSYYEDFLSIFFENELLYYYTEEDTEEAEATMSFISEHLSTTPLIFFMSITDPTYPQVGFIFEMEESDFESSVLPYLEANSVITEISDHQIYTPSVIDASFTYIDGNLLISEDEELPTNIINGYLNTCETAPDCMDSLNSDPLFVDAKDTFFTDSFLDMYISDFEELMEISGSTEEEEELLSLILNEGISMRETSSGFQLKTYIKGTDLNNPAPVSLYKYMPDTNPIYFSDSANTQLALAYIKAIPEYQEVVTDIQLESDINIDNILLALENEVAVLLQDSGENFPTFTLLADLDTNADIVEQEFNKLVNFLWDEIKLEAGARTDSEKVTFTEDNSITTITKSTIEMGTSILDQFIINIMFPPSENPYSPTFENDFFTFVLTIGVTDDGLLLISTNKDIKNQYGEGLENNTEINELISENPTSLSYLSIPNINNYIQSLLTSLQNSISEEILELETTKTLIDEILSPWGTFSGTETTSNNASVSLLNIEVDIDKLITNYSNLTLPEEEFDTVLNAQKEFSDVEREDWYANDVYYLTTKDIVDGYDDGTYKPEQNINRAEFTKLVLEALEDDYYLYVAYYNDLTEIFSDIEDYTWYSPYLSTAYENDIINGYQDGTFRPQNPITRGETAQIISNIIDKYDIQLPAEETEMPVISVPIENVFTDIDGSEWYTDAVEKVYRYKIMQGTTETTFEPEREINRAESATVIKNLMEYL